MNIVDAMRIVVGKMRAVPKIAEDFPRWGSAGKPYYMAGHLQEITNRLIVKSQDKIDKYNKYPLVIMQLDMPEDVSVLTELDINLFIVIQTEKKYNAEERTDNIFIPYLYPLYEELLYQMYWSGYFVWEGQQRVIPHRKFDRSYWGSEPGQENKMNDPLDAIELLNIRVNTTNKFKCA